MMKKAINHPYEKFSKALDQIAVDKDTRWGGLTFQHGGRHFAAWNATSPRSKAKLVSDSRWNHYPLRCWTKGSKKRYGLLIEGIVENALNKQKAEDLAPLTNNSCGVWAIYMLDKAPSSIRVKMAKRLFRSPDVRIRTRCAKILPVKSLQPMLEDSQYSVRKMAMTRIGIDNCYKNFLPSLSLAGDNPRQNPYNALYTYGAPRWISMVAIDLSEREELTSLIEQAKKLDPSEKSFSMDHRTELILTSLIDRISQEDALYLMNLKDIAYGVTQAMERKMRDL